MKDLRLVHKRISLYLLTASTVNTWIVATWLLLLLVGCGSGPRFYIREKASFRGNSRVVVIPPVNFGRKQEAPELILNSIMIELLHTRRFEPADLGEVRKFILVKRIRLTHLLPMSVIKELSEEFKADYIMLGAINQFDFFQAGNDAYPVISLNLRLISARSGKVLWAATHTRRGDDSETVFGLGRVKTLEKMTEIIVRDMIETLKL